MGKQQKDTQGKKPPGYIEKAVEAMDLPMGAAFDVPRLEITSNRQILIENHCGLLEYGSEVIKINCGEIIIKVEGEGLELAAMNKNEMSLTGFIKTIEYLR